jgi:regulator of sirC expression with transglutaminase-like and TPR domain
VRAAIPTQPPGPGQRLRALQAVVFGQLGFTGNGEDYHDPRNSFLAEVLRRRVGIPISLSVLVLEVARRIGLAAWGINFPGHFLVGVRDDGDPVVIDPFAGGVVRELDELDSMLRRASGPVAEVDDELLAPTPKAKILQRMLSNLAGIYGQRDDYFGSVEVLEHMQLLDPDNRRIADELERLRAQLEDLN